MARQRNEALYTEWEDRVSRWKASGLSSEKFAAREGISRPRALVSWSHRLRKLTRVSKTPTKPNALRVVQLPVELIKASTAPHRHTSVEVVLPTGVRLLVPAEEAILRAVLRAVEGEP